MLSSKHAAALALALLALPALAAEPPADDPEMAAMMEAYEKAGTPGEAHAMLAKAAGSWKMTIKSWMDPAGEPMVSQGTVERAMILGGRVLEEKVASDMMGTPFEGVGRTGYDNVTGQYWNTWVDSMSTGLYTSHGTRDPETGVVTYHGGYNNPMTGGETKVRSVVRWDGDDKQVFEWWEDHGEGEMKTMEIVYERAGG